MRVRERKGREGKEDALLDEVRDDADAALGAARDSGADHVALARLVRAQELEEGAQEVCVEGRERQVSDLGSTASRGG